MTDPCRILLLDDEPIVTRSLVALLQVETDWHVAAFNAPREAIDALAKGPWHVVVSDYMMPEMDGLDFLSKVRKAQPSAARVLLTGYADKRNAIRSINEVGLYHYIEKPWDNDQLLLILRNGVERAEMLTELDSRLRRMSDGDRSLEELRANLLKALL